MSERCPHCDSENILDPMPWDNPPYWRCDECGHEWLGQPKPMPGTAAITPGKVQGDPPYVVEWNVLDAASGGSGWFKRYADGARERILS